MVFRSEDKPPYMFPIFNEATAAQWANYNPENTYYWNGFDMSISQMSYLRVLDAFLILFSDKILLSSFKYKFSNRYAICA